MIDSKLGDQKHANLFFAAVSGSRARSNFFMPKSSMEHDEREISFD